MNELIEAMRQSPGCRIRCRWVEDPTGQFSRCEQHQKGGWGFLGVGPVIATTADVRAAYDAGLLRCVNVWDLHHELQRLESMELMLAKGADQ